MFVADYKPYCLIAIAVQVAVCSQQLFRRNAPCSAVLFPLSPPCHAGFKRLVPERLGFGIVLPPFRERMPVIPDFPGRPGAVDASGRSTSEAFAYRDDAPIRDGSLLGDRVRIIVPPGGMLPPSSSRADFMDQPAPGTAPHVDVRPPLEWRHFLSGYFFTGLAVRRGSSRWIYVPSHDQSLFSCPRTGLRRLPAGRLGMLRASHRAC